MIALHEVASALGGEVAGPDTVRVPGPGHNALDRSLEINFNAAGRARRVHSYAHDDEKECWSYVVGRLAGETVDAVGEQPQRDDKNLDRARVIWREVVEVKGSLAAIYLARRCLSLDYGRDRHGVLRFHPLCPFGAKERAPAMIALMRDVVTNEGRAIHRTRLTRDGHKIKPPFMLAPAKGTAAKLDQDSCVTTALTIAEGVETALSARVMGLGRHGLSEQPVGLRVSRCSVVSSA